MSSTSAPVPDEPRTAAVFDVRDYGARGDGKSLDTMAINAAIMAADRAGGGHVLIPAGEYLSHSVRLRSRVVLTIGAGATLVAAEPPTSQGETGYDAPEDAPANVYQDFGHSRFRNSLIWGEELVDVAVLGPGRIYGRGLSRGNGRIASPVGEHAPQPAGHLPDVLEADGPIPCDVLVTPNSVGAFGYPAAQDTLPPGVGNKAIALRGCRNVRISGLTILHGGHFAVLASGCDNVVLENLLIDTNRDGIDVDGCSNVRISRCSVNSPWDDGICVKSSCGFGHMRPVENITISDCFVSGYREGTLFDGTRDRVIQHRGGPIGRIKLGTESSGGYRNIAITNCVFDFCRGLALEQVDGSVMEDIVISNITMRHVMNAPLFIRLGARLRAPGAEKPGTVRRINVNTLIAHDVAPEHGIFIAGVPGHCVEDVSLTNVQLHCRGGAGDDVVGRQVPEMAEGYPEPMLFGTLPAWGLYARHVREFRVRDLTLSLKSRDARPGMWLEDVAEARFLGVRLPTRRGIEDWVMRDCRAVERGM